MRILIHVPGDFNAGLDSNARGEGRWSLNFGHLFARHGHEVVFCGMPGRGEVPGATVVPLGDPLVWESYDIFADSTYWPTRADEIDAKVYLAMYWSWDDIAASFRQKYGKNHYVGIATYSRYGDVPPEARHFAKLFPFPVAEKILWDKSNAQAPELYLNWKFAFEDPWTIKRSIVSHALMHIALDLSEEFQLPLNILHAEHVFGGSLGVRCNVKPDLLARLRNHPLVLSRPECAWQETLEILDRSRLVLTNGDPPVSPLPVEAVAQGVVPLQWTTNIFEYAGPYAFDHTDDVNYLYGPVKESLRNLCQDSQQYDVLLSELRQRSEIYTYDQVYPVCLEVLSGMLNES